jgi:2-polyprenyl-6-hydroxyphenyl methylase/3-demethylubiquinone-9 3-methyltransferase
MTTIATEIQRFNRLGATWWDPKGPMRPLHVVNALRLDYVCERLVRHFKQGKEPMAWDKVRVLDVGCGGGLLSEPLARMGAHVTGIDASPGNIGAARLHAAEHGVPVDYRLGEPALALTHNERFDVVLALEVVEHVSDVAAFVRTVASSVAPGGLLFISTIDRTWKSFVFAIVGAEYVLRVLPRGSHHWRQFVRPAELTEAVKGSGFSQIDVRGMQYSPLQHTARWCPDTRVNYLMVFERAQI